MGANISMARGMVNHVLHHDAWLYFRRNWEDSEGGAYVATWSLGWFLEMKVAPMMRRNWRFLKPRRDKMGRHQQHFAGKLQGEADQIHDTSSKSPSSSVILQIAAT